jgi:hypothetical protein
MDRMHTSVQRNSSYKVLKVGRKACVPRNDDCQKDINRAPAEFVLLERHFLGLEFCKIYLHPFHGYYYLLISTMQNFCRGDSCMDQVVSSLLKSYGKALTSNVMVFGSGAFVRSLSMDKVMSGGSHDCISVLIRRG